MYRSPEQKSQDLLNSATQTLDDWGDEYSLETFVKLVDILLKLEGTAKQGSWQDIAIAAEQIREEIQVAMQLNEEQATETLDRKHHAWLETLEKLQLFAQQRLEKTAEFDSKKNSGEGLLRQALWQLEILERNICNDTKNREIHALMSNDYSKILAKIVPFAAEKISITGRLLADTFEDVEDYKGRIETLKTELKKYLTFLTVVSELAEKNSGLALEYFLRTYSHERIEKWRTEIRSIRSALGWK